MLKNRLIASLLCFLISLSAPALAGDYYIELAQLPSMDAAGEHFKTLKKAHPALMGPLKMRLQPRLEMKGAQHYVLYAGALKNRKAAEKQCARMHKADMSCFVAELETATDQGLKPEIQPFVVLPWLVNTLPPEAQPTNIPNVYITGNVKVGEVVRVSPATPAEDTPTAAPSSNIERLQLNKTIGEFDAPKLLSITRFKSDGAAYGFWQQFSSEYPEIADNLRLRVSKPVQAMPLVHSRVALQIGPLSKASARLICDYAGQHLLDTQRCQIIVPSGQTIRNYKIR